MSPVLHSGYAQAVGAALLAVLVIMPVTAFLIRKRVAWDVYLDMSVGLTPTQALGTDTGMTCEMLLGHPGLRDIGHHTGSAEQGWLLMLGITNPGFVPVRGRDFRVPLTFVFPGREIRASQILPEPASLTSKAPQMPAVHVPAESRVIGRANNRIQLSGDFTLHPRESYSVMLVLSGTPADHSRRIQDGGELTGGKIVREL